MSETSAKHLPSCFEKAVLEFVHKNTLPQDKLLERLTQKLRSVKAVGEKVQVRAHDKKWEGRVLKVNFPVNALKKTVMSPIDKVEVVTDLQYLVLPSESESEKDKKKVNATEVVRTGLRDASILKDELRRFMKHTCTWASDKWLVNEDAKGKYGLGGATTSLSSSSSSLSSALNKSSSSKKAKPSEPSGSSKSKNVKESSSPSSPSSSNTKNASSSNTTVAPSPLRPSATPEPDLLITSPVVSTKPPTHEISQQEAQPSLKASLLSSPPDEHKDKTASSTMPASASNNSSSEPTLPRKPDTPFFFFAGKSRERVKDENPSKSLIEISRLLKTTWEALSDDDKAEYNSLHDQDVVRYEKELADFKALHGDSVFVALNSKEEEEKGSRLIKTTSSKKKVQKTLTDMFRPSDGSAPVVPLESSLKHMTKNDRVLEKERKAAEIKAKKAQIQGERSKKNNKEKSSTSDVEPKTPLVKEKEPSVVEETEMMNLTALPTPSPVRTRLPPCLYGDLLFITEFSRIFGGALSSSSSLKDLSVQALERAILNKMEATNASSSELHLTEIAAGLMLTLMEVEDGPLSCHEASSYGIDLAELPLNEMNVSEVLRNYLLQMGYTPVSVPMFLASHDFLALKNEEIIQVLVYLCNQYFRVECVVERVEKAVLRTAEIRKILWEDRMRLKREIKALDALKGKDGDKDKGKDEKEPPTYEDGPVLSLAERIKMKRRGVDVATPVETEGERMAREIQELESKLNDLEKEMASLQSLIRVGSLGTDRHYASYWVFPSSSSRLHVCNGSGEWFFYDAGDQIDSLICALVSNGSREGPLKTNLMTLQGQFKESMNKSSSSPLRGMPREDNANTYASAMHNDKEKEKVEEEVQPMSDSAPLLEESHGGEKESFSDNPVPDMAVDDVDALLLSRVKDLLASFYLQVTEGGFGCVRQDTFISQVHSAASCAELATCLREIEYTVEKRYLQPPLGESSKKKSLDEGTGGTKVLEAWRGSLPLAKTPAQVVLLKDMLYDSIQWDKSHQNVKCKICRKNSGGDIIILCDKCDKGYHLYCLKPRLDEVPAGEWLCPSCQPLSFFRARHARGAYTELPSESEHEEEVDEEEQDENEEEDEEEDEEEEEDEDESFEGDTNSGSDVDEELCAVCHGEGEVLCCSTCPRVFHLDCVGLRNVPRGKWSCHECLAPKPRIGSKRKAEKGSKANKKAKPTPSVPSPVQASRSMASTSRHNKHTQDLDSCLAIVKALTKHPDAWPFLVPVNAKELPDYYDIIANPIDLKTIRTKIDALEYFDVDEFVSDIHLMFSNCDEYNPSDTEAYDCGKSLSSFFEKLHKEKFGKPSGKSK